MYAVNKNPSVADLRKFGWAMLVGFGAIGLVLWLAPWLKAGDPEALGWTGNAKQLTSLCLWALGVGLLAVSLALPGTARRIYVAWMSVMVPIGIFMSTVLLTLLFIVMLPLFSLIVRTGDPLRKKLTGRGSYWEDYKPHEPTMERMKRMF